MATNDSRIGSSTTPPSNLGGSGEAQVLVRISPTIEREFKRRDVFVELRIERAISILSGATGVYQVSIPRAREISDDASSQKWRGVRGLTIAYGALARNVEEAIKQEERRGLFDDPGIVAARVAGALGRESPARLQIGERVLYFGSDGETGREVVVIDSYDIYGVREETGSFITADGRRIAYRYGYRVVEGDQKYFAEPHQLTRDDCKPSHLRLVSSRGAAVM